MNKMFFSIRWKLVSTYLLLVLISLLLINAFINASLIKYLMDEKQNNLLSQGTIVSDQIATSFFAVGNSQSFRYMETVIKGLSIRLDTRVMLMDRSATVVIDSYDDYAGRKMSNIQEVENGLKGISSSQAYQFANVGKVIYAGVPVYSGGDVIGCLLMASSPDDIFERTDEIAKSFFKLSLGVILITAVVSGIFADIVAMPILNLTSLVKEVSTKNKQARAIVTSRDELGDLALAFNEMIGKLYKVDEMRKQFVSNVSHELRTPIASMKIIAETLMHSKPDNLEVYDDFMHDMNSELDRLNQIIQTLLNLVNLEKEGLELEYHQTIVNHLIAKTVAIMEPLAQKKNVSIIILPYHNVFCLMDAPKIRQCLINIIGNAINYTPEGGVVSVGVEEIKGEVRIRIKDTGIGIPETDLPLIFERFYRVDSARARDTGGSGLGLSIAFQIVTLHQGRIDVSSEVGVGTCFDIVVPKIRQL